MASTAAGRRVIEFPQIAPDNATPAFDIRKEWRAGTPALLPERLPTASSRASPLKAGHRIQWLSASAGVLLTFSS